MEDGHFWTNFFGQFKDLNDWIKALILILPFATFTTCFLAFLRYRERRIQNEKAVKAIQKIDSYSGQDNRIENQLNSTEQLIFDAIKRINDLSSQGNKTLQIAAPHQKGKLES